MIKLSIFYVAFLKIIIQKFVDFLDFLLIKILNIVYII
jgi:hypothetical protein